MARWLWVAILVAACAQTPPTPCPVCPPPAPAKPAAETAQYVSMPFSALPGWQAARLEPSLQAFLQGCPRVNTALRDACALAAAVPQGDEPAARRFFEDVFTPYALVRGDGNDTGLVTGYYEPILRGSRMRTDVHRHPIYGVPDDLVAVDLAAIAPETRHLRLRGRLDGRRLVPYYDRAQIEARGAALPAPVIAWTADPVELFFLQVQGSGQLELEDGERIRLAYAEQNGHPYRSLGRYLVERGELTLEQASMQAIKAWAAANPAKLHEALHANPSYVFFRESREPRGPFGALGVPLVPGYSVAVDRRHVPLGAPLYLASTYPLSTEPLERLVLAHDTGGAIRGVARVDFFWGTGEEAGAHAGRMRQPGRVWLLWPRSAGAPRPD